MHRPQRHHSYSLCTIGCSRACRVLTCALAAALACSACPVPLAVGKAEGLIWSAEHAIRRRPVRHSTDRFRELGAILLNGLLTIQESKTRIEAALQERGTERNALEDLATAIEANPNLRSNPRTVWHVIAQAVVEGKLAITQFRNEVEAARSPRDLRVRLESIARVRTSLLTSATQPTKGVGKRHRRASGSRGARDPLSRGMAEEDAASPRVNPGVDSLLGGTVPSRGLRDAEKLPPPSEGEELPRPIEPVPLKVFQQWLEQWDAYARRQIVADLERGGKELHEKTEALVAHLRQHLERTPDVAAMIRQARSTTHPYDAAAVILEMAYEQLPAIYREPLTGELLIDGLRRERMVRIILQEQPPPAPRRQTPLSRSEGETPGPTVPPLPVPPRESRSLLASN